MKTKVQNLFTLLILVVFSTFNLQFPTARAQGTAFTYQGRLSNDGNPASGNYDLKFSLFSISTGGSAAAGPETNSPVVVSNGLFTTMLDFGSSVFNGSTYWLEIGVRTNGGGSFVTLSPRQQLTPAPNAIFAENATALANGVAIGSAQNNMVQPGATFAFIGGGLNNQVDSVMSVINGGNGNSIGPGNMGSVVAGGFNNVNNGSYSTVSGGQQNTVSGMYSTIGGGQANSAKTNFATVGGGHLNTASGQYSTIAGGDRNTASDNESTVGGGTANISSGNASIVGGGDFNTASGNNSTIGGGAENAASETTATVGGGSDNIASGISSTVPGGFDNVASGSVSFAAGEGAQAVNDNSFVWSDGGSFGFSSTLPKQFKIAAANGVEMDVAGSSGVNPAALFVNSISTNGVGLYVVQPISSDACMVLNSFSAASSYVGGGDLIKGFGWTKGTGLFGTPNQLVFEVTVLGDVSGHSFNSTSDRNAKENFSSISPAEILNKVVSLPVSQWNFKGEQKEVQHIGPMAQDFHAVFGLDGTEDKRISLTDEGGVALAAIQGLNQKLDEKDSEIKTLKLQNDILAHRLNELESTVKQLATQK
jgi:trimeric autotransporter adhesin